MGEAFSDTALRMTALSVAHETAPPGQTTGGILYAAEMVYRFLTGGALVNDDGVIRVARAGEAATKH